MTNELSENKERLSKFKELEDHAIETLFPKEKQKSKSNILPIISIVLSIIAIIISLVK